jgi:hypothetical protein
VFTRLDIAVQVTGGSVAFAAKRGLIPARIGQVPIPSSMPQGEEGDTTQQRFAWAAVSAEGSQTLNPKIDFVPVSAMEGDYELGLTNFCPYHAVNGMILHKGTNLLLGHLATMNTYIY